MLSIFNLNNECSPVLFPPALLEKTFECFHTGSVKMHYIIAVLQLWVDTMHFEQEDRKDNKRIKTRGSINQDH